MGQWEALRNGKGGTVCCNIGRKGTVFLKERQHVEGATEKKLIDGSVQREQKTEISQCTTKDLGTSRLWSEFDGPAGLVIGLSSLSLLMFY